MTIMKPRKQASTMTIMKTEKPVKRATKKNERSRLRTFELIGKRDGKKVVRVAFEGRLTDKNIQKIADRLKGLGAQMTMSGAQMISSSPQPRATSPIEAHAIDLFSSMSQEQFDSIIGSGVLSAEQSTHFSVLFTGLKDLKQPQEKAEVH